MKNEQTKHLIFGLDWQFGIYSNLLDRLPCDISNGNRVAQL